MMWRVLKQILRWSTIASVTLVVLGLIAIFANRGYWAVQLEAERDALRELGLPGTRAEFAEWYAIPEGVENAADVYDEAMSRYVEPAPGTWQDVRPISDYDYRLGEMLDSQEVIATRDFLSDNEECIELLTKAVEIPFCRIDQDFTNSWFDLEEADRDINRNEFSRNAARLLSARAMLARDAGDWEAGVDSIEAALSLVRYPESDPDMIGFFVSLTVYRISMRACESLVSGDLVPASDLARLQHALRRAAERANMDAAIYGDMFHAELMEQAKTEDSDGTIDRYMQYAADLSEFGIMSDTAAGISGLEYRDQILQMKFARWYTDLRDRQLEDLVTGVSEFRSGLPRSIMADPYGDFSIAFTVARDDFFNLLEIQARSISGIRSAQIGVAARRYAQQHHAFPETVEALAPYFDAGIPVDPFTGESFQFGYDHDRWWVYSVGRDRVAGTGLVPYTEEFGGDDIGFIVLMPPSD